LSEIKYCPADDDWIVNSKITDYHDLIGEFPKIFSIEDKLSLLEICLETNIKEPKIPLDYLGLVLSYCSTQHEQDQESEQPLDMMKLIVKIKSFLGFSERASNHAKHLWDTPLESQSRLCKSPKEDWICVKGVKRNFECYSLDEPKQQKARGRLTSLFDL
jgi:hypothetical protein